MKVEAPKAKEVKKKESKDGNSLTEKSDKTAVSAELEETSKIESKEGDKKSDEKSEAPVKDEDKKLSEAKVED